MPTKILFIDRDGNIIVEPPADKQVDSLEKLEFEPGAISALKTIRQHTDYYFAMVTNQDGLGSPSFPEDTFWPAHVKMLKILSGEGVDFDAMHIDPSLPEENSPNRKPGTGMLTGYYSSHYNLPESIVIGDRLTDVQLAKNLGAKAIWYASPSRAHELEAAQLQSSCVLVTDSWAEIARYLCEPQRIGRVRRDTNETQIEIEINLDGSGQTEISTGLHFFDHMLDQIGKHSNSNLRIKVAGDLEVDEHHTIEDTAIALGEAVLAALGDKKHIERYGFTLPMDDCLCQAAIDFGGRPWLVWDAEFRREKVGDMPTEMFMHFFKSFSDAARCNLNIKAEGANEHHKIEGIFKALAKALKMAAKRDMRNSKMPSTKGTL
jgi:imidazoleglycerol-phosphate dehydratase / histidinol-phosphatase